MNKMELLIKEGALKKSPSPVQTCACCRREHYYLTTKDKPLWLIAGKGGKVGGSAKCVSYCKRCGKKLFPFLYD